jgi:hypothetical protein
MAPKSKLTPDHINWLKVQDAKGVPRPEIVRRFAEETGISLSIGRLRQIVGTREPRTSRLSGKAPVRATITATADELACLRDLAAEFGYRNSYGAGAGEGNLSDLLAAIAAGELVLARKSP